MKRRDPYTASLAVTAFFFCAATASLAWLAHRWPIRLAVGAVLFFLLIYGKLNFLCRPFLRRNVKAPAAAPPESSPPATERSLRTGPGEAR